MKPLSWGLYILATAFVVVLLSDGSIPAQEKTLLVVFILLAGAFLAGIHGIGHDKRQRSGDAEPDSIKASDNDEPPMT